MLFAIIGAAVGTAQFILLKTITTRLLTKNKSILLPLCAKLVLYALALICLLLWFKIHILQAGIGFAAGLIAAAFTNLIVFGRRNNP